MVPNTMMLTTPTSVHLSPLDHVLPAHSADDVAIVPNLVLLTTPFSYLCKKKKRTTESLKRQIMALFLTTLLEWQCIYNVWHDRLCLLACGQSVVVLTCIL